MGLAMSDKRATRIAPVLSWVDRASEAIFGVLMTLSFTGTMRVATAGRQEVRTMLIAALSCNLAWGLTDAVMYLIARAAEHNRMVELFRHVHASQDATKADALIARVLPQQLADAKVIEAIRDQVMRLPELPAGLGLGDYFCAAGVALIVVLATLPIVIPFMVLSDFSVALWVSNGLALVTLFVGGWIFGRYGHGRPWRSGLTMAAVGAVLVVAIIALGG